MHQGRRSCRVAAASAVAAIAGALVMPVISEAAAQDATQRRSTQAGAVQPNSTPASVLIAATADTLARADQRGLKASIARGEGEPRLSITAEGGTAARLTIPAPGGTWDLGGRTLVTRVHNVGKRPATVRLRIENEGSSALTDACQMPVLVSPGEAREVELRVIPRPEDPTYAPFKPFMMYFKNINVRDNTVDPRAVARLVVEIDRPEQGHRIELTPIMMTGTPDAAQPKFFPFVDQFGQYVHSNWPGKIRSDDDFKQRREDEARERGDWSGPEDWNEYGGWARGPKLKGTGFFRAEKHQGKWWLVDPEGRLFWSYGPTGVGFGGDLTPVTDREHWFRDMPARNDPQWGGFYKSGRGATYMYYEKDRPWVGYDVARANLVRKYGDDYERKVSEVSHERLRSWGFNTMANWSAPEIYLMKGPVKRTPYTVAIHTDSVPKIHYRMQDIYHPDWEPHVRERLMREKGRTADDPFNLGYFVDNERWWGWRPRAAAVGEETLKNPPERHAKVRMIEMLKAKHGEVSKLNAAWGTQHASWEALLAHREVPDMKNERVLADCGDFGMMFAERYFTIVKDAVKQAAPNNMYLGVRFHGHVDKAVVAMCGKHADVVSYNVYDNPPDGRVNQYRDLDLPIMSTEWGVGSDPTQTPFRGDDVNVDPTARARDITRYAEQAIRHPNIVGAHFFQYRDQPITGRPDGEATLRGFVNIVDTPNFELVQANRRIGYGLYEMRAKAK